MRDHKNEVISRELCRGLAEQKEQNYPFFEKYFIKFCLIIFYIFIIYKISNYIDFSEGNFVLKQSTDGSIIDETIIEGKKYLQI